MNTAEQVMDMQRSALATWSDLSVTAMTGAERWFTLQIDVMRSLFDGGLDQTRQLGDLDNPQSLLTAMSSMSKPMMDSVMSYHNESFQILQTTSLELSNILNQHWRGSATKIQSLAEDSALQSNASTSTFPSQCRAPVHFWIGLQIAVCSGLQRPVWSSLWWLADRAGNKICR